MIHLQHQYHSCWCPGEARNQDINTHAWYWWSFSALFWCQRKRVEFSNAWLVELTFEMLTVHGQQHSFLKHEQMFLWKCQSFWDRNCLDLRGTRTPNLQVHAECSNHLSYQGQTFAVPCFLYWLWQYRYFNSLGPCDAIWRQKTGSTLAQVMACCLMAPSHYLNQCWLIISEVQWHSYFEDHFGLHASVIFLDPNMWYFWYICILPSSQILVVNWQN